MAEEVKQQDPVQPAASAAQTSGNPKAAESEPLDAAGIEELRRKVVEALKTCYDPEIPVDIYELGLIYDIAVEPTRAVTVKMTLTTPACPSARTLPGEVEDKIYTLANAKDVKVEIVWDPPWDKEKMSEAAKLQLGLV
jgi:FeS assembly SUF system protein